MQVEPAHALRQEAHFLRARARRLRENVREPNGALLSQSDGRYIECRALERALADLTAKYERMPPNSGRAELGRMIQELEAEIALRNKSCER